MALPKRRHRLLIPQNGIHGFVSWNVESLDDVESENGGPFDPTTDLNKVARVFNTVGEGEGASYEIKYWSIGRFDDSDPPQPFWVPLGGDAWPFWTVLNEGQLVTLNPTEAQVGRVARTLDDQAFYAFGGFLDNEGDISQIWKRLDNVSAFGLPITWVIDPEGFPSALDGIDATDQDQHGIAYDPSGTGPHYFVLERAEYDGEQWDKTWRPLDAEASESPASLITPLVYQGQYTGAVNVSSTTWADIMGALPGTFTDVISEGITRAGSTYQVSRAGFYRFTASFLSYGQDCYFALRLRRSGSTLLQRAGFATSAAASVPVESGLNGIFQANAGDIVTLQYCRKNNAGASVASTIDGEPMNFGSVSLEWIGVTSLPIAGADGIPIEWIVDPEGSPTSLNDIDAYEEDLHKVAYVPNGGSNPRYFVLAQVFEDGEGDYYRDWRPLDVPATDISGKVDKRTERVNYSGTARTVDAATDFDKFHVPSNASLQTWTLPLSGSVEPVRSFQVMQGGAGNVRFVGAVGVTVLPPKSPLQTFEQYSVVEVKLIAANIWLVTGDVW